MDDGNPGETNQHMSIHQRRSDPPGPEPAAPSGKQDAARAQLGVSLDGKPCWSVAGPAAPSEPLERLLADMRRASALVDQATTSADYVSRCVALALIARQFLREVRHV